jgi:hypothetical protein
VRTPTLRRAAALLVPLLVAGALTAAAPGWLTIRIRPGDTLWAIAQRYHTTVAALVRLNHLPGDGNLIIAGAVLRVPGHPAAHRPAVRTRWWAYRVQPGDSLFAISRRFGVNWRTVARHNHLFPSLQVDAGALLWLPRHLTRRADGDGGPVGVVARDRALLAETWEPSTAAVQWLLVDTAHAWGVSPSLVLAVADLESGFNPRAVSSADAIGVMQVLPATGRFVAQYVVHRPLNLFHARDDITAGVAYLAILLREAPLRDAIGGYYQGLASVRAHGMFPETRWYVRTVIALRRWFA